MNTTIATTTKSTKSSKRVEISVWGLRGRLASDSVTISSAPVRVQLDGMDDAIASFGRRVARELGGGVYACGKSSQGYDSEGSMYEITFGRAARGGGTNVVGSCWIKVYR